MRTHAIVLSALLALSACTTLSSEDKNQLTLFLENAAQYYDTGHYLRAYQQWDRALEHEPENSKARLGQAWSLYQLGRMESADGVKYLQTAEERFDLLRKEDLEGQRWKAELGYALVQERWVDLLDRKARKLEQDLRTTGFTDEASLRTATGERDTRIGKSEAAFLAVLADDSGEPTDKLTCWLGLARLNAMRGDFDRSLSWAKKYEEQVIRSKRFWTAQSKRNPEEALVAEDKLIGAEIQEAELRDVLGNVLFKLGRLEEASAELDTLIALAPERASAYLNRGMIRHAQRDWDLARSDYQRFLNLTELPPGDPTVVEATRRLRDMETRLRTEDEGAAAPPSGADDPSAR